MEIALTKFRTFTLNYKLSLLFFAFLFIGLYNLDDYGISWDEEAQRDIGLYSYNYIFKGDEGLKTFDSNDHGPAFELPLVILERLCRIDDSRNIYLFRHFLSHLFFLIGAFFCAKLVSKLYKNNLLTVSAFFMVVLFPRFYEDSFVNTKDIPFLSLFFICFYFIHLAFEKMKPSYFILLGISLGIMISIRVMGIILFLSVLFFLLLDLIRGKEHKKMLLIILIFFATTLLTIYLNWPYLWEKPFVNFKTAFASMSKYGWKGDNLFMGKFVNSSALSWNYIPVWFCITVPLLYLLSGLSGIILVILSFFKKIKTFFDNSTERNNLYYLICFIAPVVAVILFKSVLYDGWRHLYFIYAPFVLLAIYFLHFLYVSKVRKLVVIILSINIVYMAYSTIKIHPFQNVYFNELIDRKTPGSISNNYEMDYWGVAYRQSLEYILEHDTASKINILAGNTPGIYNSFILERSKRNRLHYTEMDSATYLITNFRWHPQGYPELGKPLLNSITVYNSSINGIYKLK